MEAAGPESAIGSLDELAGATSADTHSNLYKAARALVLAVVPPLEGVVADLTAWLIAAGVPVGQVVSLARLQIAGTAGRSPISPSGRGPSPQAEWLEPAGLLLVVEIGSDGAGARAYAAAGVEHYWTVSRGADPAIVLYRLGPDGAYALTAEMSLEWLLPMPPAWVLKGRGPATPRPRPLPGYSPDQATARLLPDQAEGVACRVRVHAEVVAVAG